MSGGSFWGPYYSRETKRATTTTTEDPIMPVEIDNSSGLHVFEAHAPSVGMSFFTLVMALIALGFAYGLYKKCCSGGPCCGLGPPPPPVQAVQTPQPAQDQLQPLLQILTLKLFQRPASPPPMLLPSVCYQPAFETARITAYEDVPSPAPSDLSATPTFPATAPSAPVEQKKNSIANRI